MSIVYETDEEGNITVKWDEDITPVKPFPPPKASKPLPPQDTWIRFDGKKYSNTDDDFIKTPVNEPPICCEDKPAAMQPRDRFANGWRPGQLTCDPAKGGCGTDYEKVSKE